MAAHGKSAGGKEALAIVEEAFHLARTAPARALAWYYLGSAPFVLGLLYFWGDMSKSAWAHERLVPGSLGLCALFVWMKTWQAVYAAELRSVLAGTAGPELGPARLLATARTQAILQPIGLFLLPVTLLFVLPFAYVYAFFQNATALGHGDDPGRVYKTASKHARLWPRQNMIVIWSLSPFLLMAAAGMYMVLVPVAAAFTDASGGMVIAAISAVYLIALLPLSPFGMAVAINIGSLIMLVPALLKIFLGTPSYFADNPMAMMNSTFFAAVVGLSYLCLDPLAKAAYVLRCFYAESLSSGADLKAVLREVRRAALIGILIVMSAAAAWPGRAAAGTGPAERAVSAEELDRAIGRELQKREYSWRLPRPAPDEDRDESWLSMTLTDLGKTLLRWAKAVKNWLKEIGDWLRRYMPKFEPETGSDLSWTGRSLTIVMYILIAGLAAVFGVLMYRVLRRKATRGPAVAALALGPLPDLDDESTTAEALPEDEWLGMAAGLADQGEFRLALRAVFLASLAGLSKQGLIRIARFKSNRDYQRELTFHAHVEPTLPELFMASVGVFESVWYGTRPATRELVATVMDNQRGLSHHGSEG